MPAHLSLRCLVLTAAISAWGPVVPGGAAELNPAALVYKSPDQIKWNRGSLVSTWFSTNG